MKLIWQRKESRVRGCDEVLSEMKPREGSEGGEGGTLEDF